jgi:hypothetical protein
MAGRRRGRGGGGEIDFFYLQIKFSKTVGAASLENQQPQQQQQHSIEVVEFLRLYSSY